MEEKYEDSINNCRKRFQWRRRHQADIKTMTANGICHECHYCTYCTKYKRPYRNNGVTPEFLEKQIDSVFTDIYPDAVKIGMVSSVDLIKTIAEN